MIVDCFPHYLRQNFQLILKRESFNANSYLYWIIHSQHLILPNM